MDYTAQFTEAGKKAREQLNQQGFTKAYPGMDDATLGQLYLQKTNPLQYHIIQQQTQNEQSLQLSGAEKAQTLQMQQQKDATDQQRIIDMAKAFSGAGLQPTDIPSNDVQQQLLYQQIQDKTYKPKEKPLSAPDKIRHDALTTALSSLDAAETNLVTAGGAKGPIGGALAMFPLIGQFTDPAGASYHATKIELATQLAKAITGGVRPGQNVIDAYMHSLPDVNDTPEFAAKKIAKVRNELLTQGKAFKFQDILDQYQPQSPLQKAGVLPQGVSPTTPQTSPQGGQNDTNSYLDKYFPK